MSIRAFNYINILKINEIQKYIQHYFLIIRVDFLLIINVISP